MAGDKLKVVVDRGSSADSFYAAMNEAGWLGGGVEAAALLRQGHSPSMLGAATGVGVLKLLKPRAAKELPRKFVLAVTGDRVVAYDADSHGRGEKSDSELHVTINPDEVGSWERSQVSMRTAEKGITANGDLVIDGREIPCAAPDGLGDDAVTDLIAKLGG
jgi:hypothetical protein